MGSWFCYTQEVLLPKDLLLPNYWLFHSFGPLFLNVSSAWEGVVLMPHLWVSTHSAYSQHFYHLAVSFCILSKWEEPGPYRQMPHVLPLMLNIASNLKLVCFLWTTHKDQEARKVLFERHWEERPQGKRQRQNACDTKVERKMSYVWRLVRYGTRV